MRSRFRQEKRRERGESRVPTGQFAATDRLSSSLKAELA
jgi:hypothetical protein